MDNKKDAAMIAANLGVQLIAASISFIAIIGGITGFILTSTNPEWPFYIIYYLALGCFVLSIVFGGLGVDFIKRQGEQGKWRTKEEGKKNWFSLQVKAIFFGILCMVILPFTGKKDEDDKTELKIIQTLIKQDLKKDSVSNLEDVKIHNSQLQRILTIERNLSKLQDSVELLKSKK